MSFYLFRSVNTRQKEYHEMEKAVKSAVDVVVTLSEKGVPTMSHKLNDVESRIEMMEQNMKRIQKMSSALNNTTGSGGSAPNVTKESEEDAIKAARAARLAASTSA